MIFAGNPYYTYSFGSMGRTLATATQTGFFQWFHMVQTEQAPQPPGQSTRFRPSGEKFRELCYLDVLEERGGGLVEMELVVRRDFIDGRSSLFAQDLVKSFLFAALPDACQHLLEDFMREMNTRGSEGSTHGFRVFSGRRDAWTTKTGWSRLSLHNVKLPDGSVLVVRVRPNPEAPNAKPVKGKWGRRMRRIFGTVGLLSMFLCACSPHHKGPELSLKGSWKVVSQRVQNCGKDVPVRVENLTFDIQDAPLMNHTVSSFNLQDANVTGNVTMTLHMEGGHPITAAYGLLVGEIVKSGSTPARLQGYILSEAEYGAWVAKKKQSPPPPDAGEVDLEISGNAVQGYSLIGDVRSSSACGKFSQLDASVRDLTGNFGRGVPAEWSANVTLGAK